MLDACKDDLLKILLPASVISAIIEYNDNGFESGGWISGASIFLTFVVITIISSVSAFNCQQKILYLTKVSQKQEVSVFRNSNQSISIPVEELLVGDIYRIQSGMIVPADTILI